MNKLTHNLARALLGLTLVATACTAAAPATPVPPDKAGPAASPAGTAAATVAANPSLDRSGSGGTLTIAMSAGNVPYPTTPPDQGFEGRRFVGWQIYDGLLNFNLDQGDAVPSPQPGLAESYKVGDDKLTWTFTLRKGVKFHDGTPFNADAVIFQLDRILKKDSPFFDPDLFVTNRSNTVMIASYRKVDDDTVEIKTPVPYSFLPWDITFVLIPSPAAVQKWGNKDYVNHATGTGPFKVAKYVDGQVLELEPNADYWGGKPKLDKLILRPMPDAATRLSALQSGDVTWAEVPPPDSVDQLRSAGFNVLLKQYPHTILLMLDVNNPPFNNPKVRQALEYAIDRDKMCTALLNKLCNPAYQFAYEGHQWYDPEFGKTYKYDPAKAKALLAEAGVASGLSFTIAYPTGGSGNMWPGPMMELLQSNFKDVGVDMKLAPIEWNNILTIFRTGLNTPEYKKYQGIYFSHSPQTPPSLFLFGSTRIPPAGCCNPMGYRNAEFDKLMAEAQGEFDTTKQDALFRQGMGIVANDAPTLFVVHDLNLRVLSPKVRGFIQPQSWFADLKNVWVQK